MKLSVNQLRQIIAEEASKALNEAAASGPPYTMFLDRPQEIEGFEEHAAAARLKMGTDYTVKDEGVGYRITINVPLDPKKKGMDGIATLYDTYGTDDTNRMRAGEGSPVLNNLQLTYPKIVGRILRSKMAEDFMLDLEGADEAEGLSILADYLEVSLGGKS